MKDKSAKMFKTLSYLQLLEKRLAVMDATAVSLCMDNDVSIVVFNLNKPGNLKRIIKGESVGTLVKG